MRLRFIAYFAVSLSVLVTGCAQYSEAAVAARMELAAMNAEGLDRATANLAAKAAQLDADAILDADRATIRAVLVAVNDGYTSDTIETLYIEDARKTRAALAVARDDWQTLVDEFNAAAENQRIQGRMTASELEAARKLNLFKAKGGTE